jgi:ribonuclease HI
MSEPGSLTLYIDGAARGNPGPAAFAYVIERDGDTAIEHAACLGHMTNNVAEYTALVRALERADQLGGKRLMIFSDSELLVKQMTGEYRVKNEDLRVLYEQAKRLCRRFDAVTIRHVPRSANSRADALCNQVLNGSSGPASRSAAKHQRAKMGSPIRAEAVRDEAMLCLRAAAAAWARGNASDPRPEDVWDQLWSVLEEHGVLRVSRPSGP